MTRQGKTPVRGIRVDTETWQAALTAAFDRRESLPEVIRAFLVEYIRGPSDSEAVPDDGGDVRACPRCHALVLAKDEGAHGYWHGRLRDALAYVDAKLPADPLSPYPSVSEAYGSSL